MKVLKIYSLILFGFAIIFNILRMLNSEKKQDRIAVFISLMLYIPAIIYIIKS